MLQIFNTGHWIERRRKRSLTYESAPAVRGYSVDIEKISKKTKIPPKKQEKKEFPETWLWVEEKLE